MNSDRTQVISLVDSDPPPRRHQETHTEEPLALHLETLGRSKIAKTLLSHRGTVEQSGLTRLSHRFSEVTSGKDVTPDRDGTRAHGKPQWASRLHS